MKRLLFLGLAMMLTVGCSLAPAEKAKRADLLKDRAKSFIGAVQAGNFEELQRLSTGRFPNAQAMEQHLKQPWAAGPTLTQGALAAMSWVTDTTAKVKIVWTFQQGAQQSYSAETFVWVWKGGEWKYDGRSLR